LGHAKGKKRGKKGGGLNPLYYPGWKTGGGEKRKRGRMGKSRQIPMVGLPEHTAAGKGGKKKKEGGHPLLYRPSTRAEKKERGRARRSSSRMILVADFLLRGEEKGRKGKGSFSDLFYSGRREAEGRGRGNRLLELPQLRCGKRGKKGKKKR